MASGRRSKYGCVRAKSYCGGSRSKRRRGRGRSRRSRKRSRGRKKCMRAGPKTRNPFFNFLRQFRKKHCKWSVTKIAVEGAKCWCSMNRKDKQKFYREACGSKKGRGRRRRSRRGRSCGRKSKRRRSRRRKSRKGRCL